MSVVQVLKFLLFEVLTFVRSNYSQIGLQFTLFSAEALFNKGAFCATFLLGG